MAFESRQTAAVFAQQHNIVGTAFIGIEVAVKCIAFVLVNTYKKSSTAVSLKTALAGVAVYRVKSFRVDVFEGALFRVFFTVIRSCQQCVAFDFAF